MRFLEKSSSSEPLIERGMRGRFANPGSSIKSRVFLALGGAPFCSASPRLFALDRQSKDPAALRFVGRLSRLVNLSPSVDHAAGLGRSGSPVSCPQRNTAKSCPSYSCPLRSIITYY